MPGRSRQPTLRSRMLPFSGAGGVLVGPHDGGVDHDVPVDLPDGIRAGLGMGQQALPGPISLPAAEPLIAGLPGPIALGQIPPRHPGGQLPQDSVDHLAMVGPLATRATVGWQQWGDLSPGLVSELVAADHATSLSRDRQPPETTTAPSDRP